MFNKLASHDETAIVLTQIKSLGHLLLAITITRHIDAQPTYKGSIMMAVHENIVVEAIKIDIIRCLTLKHHN